MSAEKKTVAGPDGVSPSIDEALFDDLNSDNPSAEAVAWTRLMHDRAMAILVRP